MLERFLASARRLWRWLFHPECPADCPKRGPNGEMCRDCYDWWSTK